MATTTRSTPAPAGAAPHQLAGWLPTDSGLDWLDGLRERHIAAAEKWAECAQAAGDAMGARDAEMADHRLAVRQAIESGAEPPPQPDPAVAGARLAVARGDVVAAERQLGDIIVTALTTIRERRAEVENVDLGPDLRRSLAVGPGADRGRRLAEIRAELAAATEPNIEVHMDANNESEAA